MGTPAFGTVNFASVWTVVAALVTFLAIPLSIGYGIRIGRRAVGAIASAMK